MAKFSVPGVDPMFTRLFASVPSIMVYAVAPGTAFHVKVGLLVVIAPSAGAVFNVQTTVALSDHADTLLPLHTLRTYIKLLTPAVSVILAEVAAVAIPEIGTALLVVTVYSYPATPAIAFHDKVADVEVTLVSDVILGAIQASGVNLYNWLVAGLDEIASFSTVELTVGEAELADNDKKLPGPERAAVIPIDARAFEVPPVSRL